jgi:two-component system, cell cycle sensor histidine kinase and response regulator CckA
MGAEPHNPGSSPLGSGPALAERNEFERALQESEERFRRLAEASYEGIAIVDGDRVVDANPQAAALLGYELSEYIGKRVGDLIAPESQAIAAEHMRSMNKHPWEGLALHKNGSRVLVEVRARMVSAGERTLRVAIFRDVGERRAIEQRLRDTEKMQVIGRLAGSVAHDFNNLLTVILGCAHLIENNLTEGDPSRELAAEITAAGERAASLTRQLLSFARRQVPDLRVLDVNDVIRGMAQMLERLLGEDVNVVLRLGRDIAPVRADRGHLEQILMNLCTNGRDAMPQGGELAIVTEMVNVGSGVDPPPGRWVHLVVADHGAGMDAKTLARVFEPLFTTKDVGRGTGLGLSTVQAVVVQSGGHVSIVSEVDAGTTAHVWLPALEGAPRIVSSAPREDHVPRGAETVMLVEDDLGVRSLVDSVLRSLGYSVVIANPGEAERVARSHAGAIDLLVSDVVMPGLSGPAVAALVRAECPAVRVLYISGYSDDVLSGHMDGATLLSKPFTPSDLGRKVREVLDRNLALPG